MTLLTPTTMYNKTRNALYSTPPSSSICSSVNPVKRLFRPTVAAKVMYGASETIVSSPVKPVSRRPMVLVGPIVAVRGIVNVFVNVLEAFGANLSTSVRAISNGVGKPPKPDILVSCFREVTGRREYVRGSVDVVFENGRGSPL